MTNDLDKRMTCVNVDYGKVNYRYSAYGEVKLFIGTGRQLDRIRIYNHISGYYLYKYRHYEPQ